jgi:hypothetical protein
MLGAWRIVANRDESRVLDKLLSSDVKLEILALFHNDPGPIEGVEGVARRIGRSLSETEKGVQDLLDIGILQRDSEGIRLNVKRDGEIQELVSNRLKIGVVSEMSDLEVSAENNPVRYAARLGQGDHAVLLYLDEAVKRDVVLSFLKAGLSKGNAALYLISEKGRDQETEWLRRAFEIREAEQRRALTIMSSEEWYLERGKASADTIISNWMNLANEKMKEGWPGLQSVTEMKPLVENVKWSELAGYERRLGRKLPQMYCGLCVYEAASLPNLTDLLDVHGHGIFTSIAFPLG